MISMGVAVSWENVCKLYNQIPVVNNLSFTINKGEMFGLLGPNGAGKSTTIRMLTTLTKPTRGKIEVGGFDINEEWEKIGNREYLINIKDYFSSIIATFSLS
jgi:ABC-2 type transport system ATP-binding protein